MVQLLSFSAINMIMNAFSMFLAHLILLIFFFFFFFSIMEMQKREKKKIEKKVVLKFISSKFAIQNSNV